NAPPLRDILQDGIQFISDQQQSILPEDVNEQIMLLIEHLREKRCLVVLDNVESILQAGQYAGLYRKGYDEYGKLFQMVGEAEHQSCLLLTSREKPREIAILEGEALVVRSYPLKGLRPVEGRKILEDKGLHGAEENLDILINHYAGNPLALKLVAQSIQEVF